jgi:hypothetical protein
LYLSNIRPTFGEAITIDTELSPSCKSHVGQLDDVFLDDYPGIPPNRSVQLTDQLAVLLERGFVRPRTSPRRAPVLFARRQMVVYVYALTIVL